MRERAGMTQQELADAAGIARPNIAAYESGKRAMSPDMRDRLERATSRPSAALTAHAAEVKQILAAAGASNVRVFGSVARGTDTHASDIDLLVDLGPRVSAFRLGGARRQLVDRLGFEVDIVPAEALEPRHGRVLAEAVPL
jgi:uncharacterized protein